MGCVPVFQFLWYRTCCQIHILGCCRKFHQKYAKRLNASPISTAVWINWAWRLRKRKVDNHSQRVNFRRPTKRIFLLRTGIFWGICALFFACNRKNVVENFYELTQSLLSTSPRFSSSRQLGHRLPDVMGHAATTESSAHESGLESYCCR